MPGLLGLPNEILNHIIDDTIPESVEAFSESSMHISSLAHTRLNQHYDDMDSYCVIKITNRGYGGPGVFRPLELLKDILQEPYLIRYPQTLRLGKFDTAFSYEPPRSDELRAQVVKALIECCHVPSNQIDEWAIRICSGDCDTGTALLLALLPNIQCLSIESQSCIGYYTRQMVFNIIEASHDLRDAGRCLALNRLVRVQMSNIGLGGGKDEMDILAQLSALPSMRVLRCTGVIWPPTVITNRSRHAPLGGVTRLEIIHSVLHPDHINRLLESVRALTHFTYNLHAGFTLRRYPTDICKVLGQHVKDTLEELDLTWYDFAPASTKFASIDSLRDFRVLKKLRVNYKFIIVKGEDGNLAPAKLTSMLPSSLQELRLVGNYDPGQNERPFEEIKASSRWDFTQLAKVFHGLPEMKEEALPNLVRVDCEGAYHEDYQRSRSCQKIREACARAGVALNGLDPELCHKAWEDWPRFDGSPGRTPQQQEGQWRSRYQMFSSDSS